MPMATGANQESIRLLIEAADQLRGFDNTIRAMKRMEGQMKSLSRTVRRKARRIRAAVEKMRRAWMKLQATFRTVRDAALKLFTAIVAFTGIPIGLYGKFQKEMSNVNTLMSKSRGELKKYEDQVIQLSNQTGKSATELSKGLYDVISAGVDSANSMVVLEQATKAAQAGITEVNMAVKAGISTINAYNKDISKLTDVYDLQFSTVKEGIITYEQLANSIGMVLPSARKLNVRMDEVYGSLAFLTKQGQNAERATTALARSFDNLAQKSGKIKEAFGFSIFDERGQFIGYQEVIRRMSKQLKGLSDQAKLAQLESVGFSERAARAIIPAVKNYKQFRDVVNEVSNSSGSMQEAYKKATDNIAFTFNRLKETAINTARKFGSIYETEIRNTMNSLRAWITTIGQFIKENSEAIKTLTLFAAKVTGIITLIAGLGTALFALTTPLGILTAGVASLAAAWYLNIGGIREFWDNKMLPIIEDVKDWTFKQLKIGWDYITSEEFEKDLNTILNWSQKILDVLLEYTPAGELWKNIKAGNWKKVFGSAAKLAVTFALAKGALGALFTGSMFTATALTGAIAAITFAVKLRRAQKQEDYAEMFQEILNLIAGGIVGFYVGGPAGAALGMTIAITFDPVGKFWDWFTDENRNAKAVGSIGNQVGFQLKDNIGYAEGGPTGNIGINEIAGVVHGQEWVAPAWMVKSKEFGPIIEQLERARKRGFQDGGYTSKNLATLRNSGLNKDSGTYQLLERLAKIAEDTEHFADVVNMLSGIKKSREDFQKLMEAIENENIEKLKEIAGINEEGNNKIEAGFSDLVSQMSSFANNMQQLTGNEAWGMAGSIISSAGQFKQQLGNFQSASGLMGQLTAGFGMANAALGAVSAFKSWNEAQNKKEEQEWKEQLQVDKKQLKAVRQIKKNTSETANNIIKAIAENPTTANIKQGQETLAQNIDILKGLNRNFGKFTIKVKEEDLFFDDKETRKYSLKERFGLSKSIAEMSFEELESFYDQIKNMSDDSFRGLAKDIADTMDVGSGELDKYSTNIDNIKKKLKEYINLVHDLEKAQENLAKTARYESFEGVKYLSAKEKEKQYRKKVEEMFKQAGKSVDKYSDEIDKMVDNYMESMGELNNVIVTIMQDVRGEFVNAFAEGESAISSFAQSSKTYFDTIKNNISGLVYDTQLNELDNMLNETFANLMETYADYEGEHNLSDFITQDNVGGIDIPLPEVIGGGSITILGEEGYRSEFEDIFNQVIELEDMNNEVVKAQEGLADIFREQAKAAGMTTKEISKLLKQMGLADDKAESFLEKIRQTKKALSSAMNSALESNNFLDFSKSLGKSIYNNVKDSLIQAFAESQTYQQMFSQWFEIDSEQIDQMLSGVSSPEEAFKVMREYLDGVEDELRAAGLDFNFAEAPTSGGSSGPTSSSYYSGPSTTGEGAKKVENNYIFSPKIDTLYGEEQTELFERWEDWQEEQESTQTD